MHFKSWFLVLIIGMVGNNVQAAELDLSQGTRTLGGSISLTANTTTDVHQLRVVPSLGYFLNDNFEIAFSVHYSTNLGDSSGSLLGGGVALLGYLDAGSVLLKSGVGFGFYTAFSSGNNSTLIELDVPLMLVFPLNDSVALNTGVIIQVFIFPDGGDPMVQLPMGFLGVQAYY